MMAYFSVLDGQDLLFRYLCYYGTPRKYAPEFIGSVIQHHGAILALERTANMQKMRKRGSRRKEVDENRIRRR